MILERTKPRLPRWSPLKPDPVKVSSRTQSLDPCNQMDTPLQGALTTSLPGVGANGVFSPAA